MNCERCGGPTWDNRSKITKGEFSPKSPHFSCKNKEDCGWAWWPPKSKEPERMEQKPEPVEPIRQASANIVKDTMEHHAHYARQVFEKAWSESGEVMKTLMPKVDAEQLDAKDWYDIKLRIAQFIAIQTQRSL